MTAETSKGMNSGPSVAISDSCNLLLHFFLEAMGGEAIVVLLSGVADAYCDQSEYECRVPQVLSASELQSGSPIHLYE